MFPVKLTLPITSGSNPWWLPIYPNWLSSSQPRLGVWTDKQKKKILICWDREKTLTSRKYKPSENMSQHSLSQLLPFLLWAIKNVLESLWVPKKFSHIQSLLVQLVSVELGLGYNSEFSEMDWELKHFLKILLNTKVMCFPYCLIPNFKVLGDSFIFNKHIEFNMPKIMCSLWYHPILVPEVFFYQGRKQVPVNNNKILDHSYISYLYSSCVLFTANMANQGVQDI